jgi:hypothetical protein
MQRSVRKTNLQDLVNKDVISNDGSNWLKEVLDPFHDSQIPPTGYPDTNVASSVVQVIKKTQNIALGSVLNGGVPANWDCHIVMWPMPSQSSAFSGNLELQTIGNNDGVLIAPHVGSSSGFPIGGVTAYEVPAGQNTYFNLGVFDPFQSTLELDDAYLTGNFRIIGMGLEVVNTTSELNVQGLVTVYRQPEPGIDPYSAVITNYLGTAAQGVGVQVDKTPSPPVSQAAAMLLAGSQTWKAKDGGYCVMTQNSIDNPVTTVKSRLQLVTNSESSPSVSMVDGWSTAIQSITVGALTVDAAKNTYRAPFNLGGMYFAGLSPATTLSINAIWIIERFPVPADLDLVVLARESPSYDGKALELYSHAMSEMPVGVMQGENPLGEWFNSVVGKVAKFAAPALKMGSILYPPLGMLGSAAEAVGNYTDSNAVDYRTERRAKNERRVAKGKQALRKNGKVKTPRSRQGPGAQVNSTGRA